MIDILEGIFERKSVYNKLYLRIQLVLKCSYSDDIQSHFFTFDNLRGKNLNLRWRQVTEYYRENQKKELAWKM